MSTIRDRFKSAWNAFRSKPDEWPKYSSSASYYRPDRPRLRFGSERSIVAAICSRIAIDVSSVEIRHVKLNDKYGHFVEMVDSRLNDCLALEANLDQTGRECIKDLVMSMLDEGCVALIPIETTKNPLETESYDVLSMRCCKILSWFPEQIEVEAYDERTGIKTQIIVDKRVAVIIENPLYSVMNEPNSTLQRLVRKLNLLDIIDDQNSSGKLDLIIQLPYVIKSEARREQAESRRKDIEDQLVNSKYGIAYTDGTERITQLNRAVENNIFQQVQYYMELLFSQLGMSKAILEGTATQEEILNYYSRTVEPILTTIVENMARKWLSVTARSQGHYIRFFRDPFKLVPVEKLADISDKLTRNAILSSNELRGIIGYKPVDDPRADELSNKNINQGNQEQQPMMVNEEENADTEEPPIQKGVNNG